MNEIINQVKRLFFDNGKNDRNFTREELQLKTAKDNFDQKMTEFKSAADRLVDALLSVD